MGTTGAWSNFRNIFYCQSRSALSGAASGCGRDHSRARACGRGRSRATGCGGAAGCGSGCAPGRSHPPDRRSRPPARHRGRIRRRRRPPCCPRAPRTPPRWCGHPAWTGAWPPAPWRRGWGNINSERDLLPGVPDVECAPRRARNEEQVEIERGSARLVALATVSNCTNAKFFLICTRCWPKIDRKIARGSGRRQGTFSRLLVLGIRIRSFPNTQKSELALSSPNSAKCRSISRSRVRMGSKLTMKSVVHGLMTRLRSSSRRFTAPSPLAHSTCSREHQRKRGSALPSNPRPEHGGRESGGPSTRLETAAAELEVVEGADGIAAVALVQHVDEGEAF